MKKINKSKIELLLLKIYIFLVIYTPIPFSNNLFNKFTFLLILFFINIIPIVIKKKKDFFSLFLKSKLFLLISIIFLSSIYSFIIILIKNTNISSIMDTRLVQNNIINILLLNIVMIYYKCKKLKLKKNDIIKILIDLASLQGIICILMYFIPQFKSIANSLYLVNAKYNIFVLTKRIYGISNDYTFGTQIYHGIIAGIIFDEIISNNKKYYANIILVLITIVLNGRTGILVFVIMFTYFTIKSLLSKNLINNLFKIIISIVLLSFSLFIASIFSHTLYIYITDFINKTILFIFESESSENYGILFDKMLYFPKGLDLIFGIGHNVYGTQALVSGYIPSDIGYVNDIFLGGIIYAVMIYLPIIKNTLLDKKYGLILSIILIITNFKGEVFRSVPIMFLILLIIVINIEGVEKNEDSKYNYTNV